MAFSRIFIKNQATFSRVKFLMGREMIDASPTLEQPSSNIHNFIYQYLTEYLLILLFLISIVLNVCIPPFQTINSLTKQFFASYDINS